MFGFISMRKIPLNPEMVLLGYFKLWPMCDEIHFGYSLIMEF